MTNIVATILMYCEEEVDHCSADHVGKITDHIELESVFSAGAHVFTGQVA